MKKARLSARARADLTAAARWIARDNPTAAKAMADLVPKISEIVWQLGEDRFPHIRHDFREDRPVLGFP